MRTLAADQSKLLPELRETCSNFTKTWLQRRLKQARTPRAFNNCGSTKSMKLSNNSSVAHEVVIRTEGFSFHLCDASSTLTEAKAWGELSPDERRSAVMAAARSGNAVVKDVILDGSFK